MFGPVGGGRGRRGGRGHAAQGGKKKKKWQEDLDAPSPTSDYELPPSPRNDGDSPPPPSPSRIAAAAAAAAAGPSSSSPKRSRSDVFKTGNPHAYMDIEIDGRDVGRVEFELFKREVPRTAENFRCLFTGERGTGRESGLALDYTASTFHRIIPGFMAQGVGLALFARDILPNVLPNYFAKLFCQTLPNDDNSQCGPCNQTDNPRELQPS